MNKLIYIKPLKSMGYRKMSDGVWAKPVGNHLLTFEMDSMKWTNWFKGADEKMCIWNSSDYGYPPLIDDTEERFLDWIKGTEAFTRIDITNASEFNFLSLQEVAEIEMGLHY